MMVPDTNATRVLSDIDCRYLTGRTWRLLSPYICESATLGRIEIPAGFVTDFNSIPRALWSIYPPWDHGVAALPHDFLYAAGALNGRALRRAEVDAVYKEFLIFDHTPLWKRQSMWLGVRAGGWKPWGKYRKQDKDKEQTV